MYIQLICPIFSCGYTSRTFNGLVIKSGFAISNNKMSTEMFGGVNDWRIAELKVFGKKS